MENGCVAVVCKEDTPFGSVSIEIYVSVGETGQLSELEAAKLLEEDGTNFAHSYISRLLAEERERRNPAAMETGQKKEPNRKKGWWGRA